MTRGLEGWNLTIERWRELDAMLRNAQWKTVLFHPLNYTQVPDVPGVYMITGGPPLLAADPHSKFEKPLYVGESEASIRSRFRRHTSDQCQPSVRLLRRLYEEAKYPTLYFHALPLPVTDVAKAEAILIECYGPPANRIRGVTMKPGVPAG